MQALDIRTVEAIRYVQPLREGGSLPAIVEADDDFPYVLKFRGAGQGKNALLAELIGGELARLLGLKVPELVFVQLDAAFGRLEPDQEIQDLLRFSVGLNLGLHYLEGAITYDPAVSKVNPREASIIVLLDSLITNIDRTVRNTNLLLWKRELWLIDHGACLYFHHNWGDWNSHAQRGFPMIKDHVLLPQAKLLFEAAELIHQKVGEGELEAIAAILPDDWLEDKSSGLSPEAKRAAYVEYLKIRLSKLELLTKKAEDARKASL